MNKNIVYAGTGHRPPRLNLDYSGEAVEKLAGFAEMVLTGIPKPDRIITGMAQGWDQALAIAAFQLKIPYVATLPFEGQESKWPEDAKIRYQKLLGGAERVEVICPEYSKQAFIKRDIWMVDNCTEVLALWDGSPKGGTWHTVNYAKQFRKPVRNFWIEWLNYNKISMPEG